MKIFLSSSSEHLPVAKALEQKLKDEGFETSLWASGVHRPSQYNLESLVNAANSSDFAVFLFAPDDTATIHERPYLIVRDNVLFELGLFIGILGRDRCFIVQSSEPEMREPSDLQGITKLKFDLLSTEDERQKRFASMAAEMKQHALQAVKADTSIFTKNDLALLKACRDEDINFPSTHASKAFTDNSLASWDDKLCMRFLRLLEHGLIKCHSGSEVEITNKGTLLLSVV